MTEKRFLRFTLLEGILLLVLGLAVLIIPKITTITLGVMVCIALFLYGVIKIFNAIMTKNYIRHYIFNIVIGSIMAILGLVLFLAPTINILIFTSLIGICFILESISSKAFAFLTKNTMYYWWIIFLIAVFQFLIGLIVILGLPSISFWFVGMLLGINFLLMGSASTSLFIANKYLYAN